MFCIILLNSVDFRFEIWAGMALFTERDYNYNLSIM